MQKFATYPKFSPVLYNGPIHDLPPPLPHGPTWVSPMCLAHIHMGFYKRLVNNLHCYMQLQQWGVVVKHNGVGKLLHGQQLQCMLSCEWWVVDD